MTRTYEGMVLLDNREVKKGWEALKSNVTGLFEKHGAEMLSARRWEERRLAYTIKHQQRGTYLLCYFKSPPDALVAIRRELEYSDPVLRSLMMTCEEIPESAYEPEAEFDESQVRVEDDTPDAPPAKGEAKGDAKTEAKGEAKTEAKGEAKTDAKDEAKTEAKTDAKDEAKTDAKDEAADAEKAEQPADKGDGDSENTDKTETKEDAS